MNNINFKKISMPSDDFFYKEYMCNLEPVVIGDMFKDDPIRKIKTRYDVIKVWGNIKIFVENEYIHTYVKSVKSGTNLIDAKRKKPNISILDYFDYTDKTPGSDTMCIEFPTPDNIQKYYKVPSICHTREGESSYFINQCFIGNKGNVANLHFDKGGTHGFLYQVFGEKRFIIIPWFSARKLAPFAQFGAWFLKNFSNTDRHDFLRWCKGKEVVLQPGDCMYVPMYCWHYADYIDDSMSISLRFRRPDVVTKLANYFYPNYLLQGIASRFVNPAFNGIEILHNIEEEYNKSFTNGKTKAKHMMQVAQNVYNKICADYEPKYMLNLEEYLPDPLPHFQDFDNPLRPNYK